MPHKLSRGLQLRRTTRRPQLGRGCPRTKHQKKQKNAGSDADSDPTRIAAGEKLEIVQLDFSDTSRPCFETGDDFSSRSQLLTSYFCQEMVVQKPKQLLLQFKNNSVNKKRRC